MSNSQTKSPARTDIFLVGKHETSEDATRVRGSVFECADDTARASSTICWRIGWSGDALRRRSLVAQPELNRIFVLRPEERRRGGGCCREAFFGLLCRAGELHLEWQRIDIHLRNLQQRNATGLSGNKTQLTAECHRRSARLFS